MNGLDYAAAGLVLFAFWRGWAKGLMRSILGPVSIVVCWTAAWMYYQNTRTITPALAIAVLGPLALAVFFWILFLILAEEEKDRGAVRSFLAIVNRLLGGAFYSSWIACCAALCMIFIVMVPFKIPPLEGPREMIKTSMGFGFVRQALGSRGDFLDRTGTPVEFSGLGERSDDLQEHAGYRKLMEDARVKAAAEDPRIAKMIRERDLVGLLSDSKIQAIMRDPELLMRVLKFNQALHDLGRADLEGGGARGNDLHPDH